MKDYKSIYIIRTKTVNKLFSVVIIGFTLYHDYLFCILWNEKKYFTLFLFFFLKEHYRDIDSTAYNIYLL